RAPPPPPPSPYTTLFRSRALDARLGITLEPFGPSRRGVDRDGHVEARPRAQRGDPAQQVVVVDHVGHPAVPEAQHPILDRRPVADRKSTRLNSSHDQISY